MHRHLILLFIYVFLISCKNSEDLRSLAGTYEKNGLHKTAIQKLDEAIKLDSKNKLAYFDRAYIYAFLKKHHKSVEDYGSIIELDKMNQLAYYNRARNYRHLKLYTLALSDLNELSTLISMDFTRREESHFMNLMQDEIDGTVTDNDIVFDVKKDELKFERGLLNFQIENYEDVIKDFKALDKNRFVFSRKNGLSYLHIGDTAMGCKEFREAILYDQDSLAIPFISEYCIVVNE